MNKKCIGEKVCFVQECQKQAGERNQNDPGREKVKEVFLVISNQILQTTIDGLKAISRVDLCVLDTEGIMLNRYTYRSGGIPELGPGFRGIPGGQPGGFRVPVLQGV